MKHVLLLLACALYTSAAHAETITQPSIMVTGYAESKIAPDKATVNVEVYSEHKDLKTAKKEQDEKVKKIVKIAEKQGIASEDIQTLYANIQPLYDYIQNSKPRFRAYAISNTIKLTVNNIDTTGAVVDAVVAAGYDRIQNIQFSLKNDRLHRDALMKQALLNAKSKATDMAAVYDGRLGRALTISESGSSNPPPIIMAKQMRAEMAMAADAGGSMPSYSPPGMIEIEQTVNVTFALE